MIEKKLPFWDFAVKHKFSQKFVLQNVILTRKLVH
jgi:hypothetical protein